MHQSEKTLAGFSIGLLTAFSLASLAVVGCAKSDGGSVKVGVGKPSARTESLLACAQKIPSTLKTVQGQQKAVCRKGDDGQLTEQPLIPSYQVISKKNIIALDQVIAVRLSFGTVKPSEQVRLAAEGKTNEFLTKVCGAHLRDVFKRSDLRARFVFQTAKATDVMAGSSLTTADPNQDPRQDSIFSNETTIKPAANQKTTTEPVKTTTIIQEPIGPREVNMILDLVLGADQGVSIKDELQPASSGPLEGSGTDIEEKRLQFCGQVLMRIAENFGLVEGRDCASLTKVVEKTDTKTTTKTETKSEVKSEKSDTSKSTAVKSTKIESVVGLLKPEGHAASDLKRLKLSDVEVFSLLEPACEGAAKAGKTEAQKAAAKASEKAADKATDKLTESAAKAS